VGVKEEEGKGKKNCYPRGEGGDVYVKGKKGSG